MYQHYRGVDHVCRTVNIADARCHMTIIVDLKIQYRDDDREGVNVPMDIYDQACVTDPKKGVEVRPYRDGSVEKNVVNSW